MSPISQPDEIQEEFHSGTLALDVVNVVVVTTVFALTQITDIAVSPGVKGSFIAL